MSSVKAVKGAKQGPVSERLARLLAAFSPWAGISLTYRQFAAELGPPVTDAAIKKWPQRKKFPADVARMIVTRARRRGLDGVTLEWVLWGEGQGPHKGPTEAEAVPRAAADLAATSQEPHGQFAARIADALLADLSHNGRVKSAFRCGPRRRKTNPAEPSATIETQFDHPLQLGFLMFILSKAARSPRASFGASSFPQ